MNVLIGCECSQTIANAYRRHGINAFSNDVVSCYGGHPEYHIKDDFFNVSDGHCTFITQDGKIHDFLKNSSWDIVIVHPPCTYLANSGGCKLLSSVYGIKDFERYEKLLAARDFFYKCFNIKCDRIAIENPKPLGIAKLPKESQVIQPYYFGDPYTKKTYLWLIGLPELIPTNICNGDLLSWCAIHSSSRLRSKTFSGIAEAIASQWTKDCLPNQLSIKF